MRITLSILQDKPDCTDPVETECEDPCYFDQFSDGKQRRRCKQELDAAFAELDDNEKKCKEVKGKQACLCNYDWCNENTDNPTNQNVLYEPGKTLKCFVCNDRNNVGVMSV